MADAMKLLPCPFCGEQPIMADNRQTGGACFVQCQTCDAETAGTTTQDEAADLWNRRASAPPKEREMHIWAKVEATARRYAQCYPEASDGRNTFVMFAEWAASEAASPPAPAREGPVPYPGETADLIDQIRVSEGAAVTIMCDNPDFNGQPNSAVEVVADWTNWQTVRFTGDNVIDALRNARDMVGGKIMGECDSLTRIKLERALTAREEAPADPFELHKAEGVSLDPCCPHCEAPGEWAGVILSASDRACYEYPGVDDGPLRAAFVAGAEAYSDKSDALRNRTSEPARETLGPSADFWANVETHPAPATADKLREPTARDIAVRLNPDLFNGDEGIAGRAASPLGIKPARVNAIRSVELVLEARQALDALTEEDRS